MQVLLGQTSIQNLVLRGRGEIEFCKGPDFTWFNLGAVNNLTTLHVKTDRFAHIYIPTAMQLQSLEAYAPTVTLCVEEPYGWAKHVKHLQLVYENFFLKAGDRKNFSTGMHMMPARNPSWPVESWWKNYSERCLYITFCEIAEGPRIKCYCEVESSRNLLRCMVLEGCKFDIGMAAAESVYNGGTVACSCGICWMCLQLERGN